MHGKAWVCSLPLVWTGCLCSGQGQLLFLLQSQGVAKHMPSCDFEHSFRAFGFFFSFKKILLGYKLHKLEQSVLIREFEFWQIMHDMEKTQEQSKQNISINPQNSLYSLSQSEQPTTLLTQSPHALHTTQGLRWPSNPCCHSRFILVPSEFHKNGIICVYSLSMPVFA